MPEDLDLHKIADSEDYQNKINNRAASIVSRVVNEELDHRNKETIENYIESNGSWHEAIEELDDEWGAYNTLDIAAIYDIIQENYQQTLRHVEDNVLIDDSWNHPVEQFRRFVLNCMAYDLAKTVDHKLNQVIQDDEDKTQSTRLVKV